MPRLSFFLTLSLLLSVSVNAEPIPSVPDAISLNAQPFPLDQVHLLSGYIKDKQDLTFDYLLSLDPQRLLYNFRIAAGIKTTVKPYGGWEKPDGFCRGHFTGHYLSACSEAYAVTGNAQFKAKCDELVAGLAECQTAFGNGYLFTDKPIIFANYEHKVPAPKDEKTKVPFYTVHKIMAGLLDCYRFTGNPLALKVVCGMADYFGKQLEDCTPAELENLFKTDHYLPLNEFGGMSEVMHNLYATTGNAEYLRVARLFDRQWFLQPLENDEDHLTGLHANCHTPMVLGALRDYEITGKPELKNVAINFWHMVVPARTFNDGGSSGPDSRDPKKTPYGEHWGLTDQLEKCMGPKMSESCVAYNMLKLTEHLFTWHPTTELVAYYQRTYFNSVLGAEGSGRGVYTYSTPLLPGSTKDFGTPEDSFWCCYGTGVEAHAQLAQPIYFHSVNELWVNMLVASELNWKEQKLQLTQTTNFPFSPTSTFQLHLAKPTEFTLHFYIPTWAPSATLTLNGAPLTTPLEPDSFATVHQTWHDGDTLVLTLPMSLRTEKLAPNSSFTTIFYGPVMLVALTDKPLPYMDAATVKDPANLLSKFNPQPTDDRLSFDYTSNAKIVFRPLFLISDKKTKYTAYFQTAPPTPTVK